MIGDIVLCRDYRNPNKKSWAHAKIDEVLGNRIYLCKLVNEDLIWKRHTDRILEANLTTGNLTENYVERNIPQATDRYDLPTIIN